MRLLAAVLAILALPAAALPQRSAPISDVRYRLQFDAAHALQRSIGVSMSFTVRGDEPVLLSMPVWTPGAYEVSDYARNVSGFSAAAGNRALLWDKLDPDTWRIWPEGARAVTVRFEARADSLDNAFNWATENFALINGTGVFLYPEGQPLEFASSVTVQTEPSWRVTSGLAFAKGTFSAPTYHELVDGPFFVGQFDLDSTKVAGRTMRLATYPVGSVTGARRETLWTALAKAVPTEAKVFGEVPWTTYTVMQIADSSYGGGMSALEHQNSNVGVVGSGYLDEPFVPSVYAHEIFHAWNVKRLRPLDLWPYRYGTAQPTTWLWVSEGITDYYADLALVRGGVITAERFRALTQEKMDHVAQLPPVALEDASLEAWLRITDGTNGIYYDKGSLAGLALDILIRDASDNSASLDQVMHDLYATAYKAGRGFTGDEWWAAVSRAAGGASFRDFNARYIDGRVAYPWNDWLKRAGWRVVSDTLQRVRLGAVLAPDSGGLRVSEVGAASVAQRAGVRVGDVIVRVEGIPASDPAFAEKWRARLESHLNGSFTIEVRRDGVPTTLRGVATPVTLVNTRVEDDPAASAMAARIRDGILTGTVQTKRP